MSEGIFLLIIGVLCAIFAGATYWLDYFKYDSKILKYIPTSVAIILCVAFMGYGLMIRPPYGEVAFMILGLMCAVISGVCLLTLKVREYLKNGKI